MKQTIYFFLIFCLLQTISCKKDCLEDPIDTDYSGPDTTYVDTDTTYSTVIAALQNDEEWTAEVSSVRDSFEGFEDRFNIIAEVYNNYGYLRQAFGLYQIPKKVGTYGLIQAFPDYPITESIACTDFATFGADGDAITGTYKVVEDESELNQVTVTSINEEQEIIRGTFNVTFYRDWSAIGGLDDTIRFESGKFDVKLKE